MSARAHLLYRRSSLMLWCCMGLAWGGGAAWAQTVPPQAAQNTAYLSLRSFAIVGSNPLPADESSAILAPFLGPQRGVADIEAAAEQLEQAMKARGYVFHRVMVPAQKPQDGEITLQVLHFTVGQVGVQGNQHFSAENIRRSMPTLLEGAVPDIRAVGQDLAAANANPAKQVQVTFRESSVPNAVDAVLGVRDQDPVSVFASFGGNMAGQKNPDDSIARATLGLQHANVFDLDHVASLTYTTDPARADTVRLLGLYYQLPWYGSGSNVSAYYTRSDVTSGLGSLGLPDVTGQGEFVGVRWSYPLPRHQAVQQTLSVALDDKHFDQGLPGTGVGGRPASLRYTYHRDADGGSAGANLEWAVNTSGGKQNTPQDYSAQGADYAWQSWRWGLDGSYQLDHWLLSTRLRGQWSDSKLLAGEKFSLGGTGSVRGFADGVVRGDYGAAWSLEALGPELNDLAQLRPVGFAEGGKVFVNGDLGASEELASVGLGLRWAYQQLQVATDLAFASKPNSTERQTDPWRLHVMVYYRF